MSFRSCLIIDAEILAVVMMAEVLPQSRSLVGNEAELGFEAMVDVGPGGLLSSARLHTRAPRNGLSTGRSSRTAAPPETWHF